MGQDTTSELKKSIDLNKPGIFVLSYALAEEVRAHPAVKVSLDPQTPGSVSFILAEGDKKREITLWQPGTAVIVKVSQPSRIFIEVVPLIPGASTNATIKIDAVLQGEDQFQSLGQAPGQVKQDLNLDSLKLYGHVAGRGDIEVRADEWMAGPAVPARIEGIAIEWVHKPRNLDLRYSAIGPGSNAAVSPMVSLGGFAGTRSRALPLLGLALELTGSGTSEVQLAVEALFLGTPIIRETGERVTLSGPSGLEPLIGLKLSIVAKQANPSAGETAQAPAKAASAAPSEAAAPAVRPARIFRSKALGTTG